jgi:hypothetical protein
MSETTLLVILGFLLTTVLGGFWGFLLKKRSWQIETEHSIHKARFDEGTKFLDALSKQVGQRFFLLQRFFWAIEEGNEEKILEREKEYFSAVTDWNSCFWRNRNKIRLLVNENQANQFLDYRDDNAGEQPTSLHYKFVVTHRTVLRAKTNRESLPAAEAQVLELNWKCSVFLERLTTEFVRRVTNLQLLQVPSGPGAAELAAPADAAKRHR